MNLSTVWERVEKMMLDNAQHRKGYRLGDMTINDILDRADDEMKELREAVDNYYSGVDETGSKFVDEAGDVIAILFHLVIKHGCPEDYFAKMIVEKFSRRFRLAGDDDA